MIVTLNA
jgi:hypothetical protein